MKDKAEKKNERKRPAEKVFHTTISQNLRTHTLPPRDSTLDSDNDPKLELSADAPKAQWPQAFDLSDAFMSHGIEAETDVFNSENDEDLEISNLDTQDHEETMDVQEEITKEIKRIFGCNEAKDIVLWKTDMPNELEDAFANLVLAAITYRG
ncbi:hypothetical protein C1645_738094 [Glomus cerebriforme]|uniref:Uncharacterized protein n=1 Tax=Glomus cerebriforme TaxID=658196 RepID=A0A397T4R9_9GLOM|nr:hypothetical protein C1645_738094 [Glomus cerebriforme]